jgi:Mlc titration factor MtfA (ptsG expression regulator)
LRSGFYNNGATNTAIHEFAHLLDKADGATDGVPELILKERHRSSWIRLMDYYMNFLRYNPSDIDAYASVNEAEFFAVVTEYYFQQPSHLQANHPELYQILYDGYENK